MTDFCNLCEQEKVCDCEYKNGEYICQDCYEGLVDKYDKNETR